MKKKALKKDFYMELRKSLNRFLSILLINALGVAFFAGVRASKPDMQLSADAFYDRSNLMDIRVIGTLGMTDGDLEAIAKVQGVKEVMGERSVDMFCVLPKEQLNIQVMSVPDQMNRIQVQEGRMPEAENECLVDAKLVENGKCQIGETLTLKSGTDDETEDLVTRDTFTVVGTGTTSIYLSLDRGTTSIGSGNLDGFLVVQPSVFVKDYYTQICVTAEGASELTCYTEAYDDLVDETVERIEDIEKERCAVRYAEVQEEGQEKIADAEAEVAEGEEKLADAGQELEDARKKLEDARVELEDGRKELADGEKEIAEKEQELLDAKQEVADGWKKINDAKEQLVLATIEYERGYAKYEEGMKELNAGYSQLQGLKDARNGLGTIVDTEQQYQQLKQLELLGSLTAEQAQMLAALEPQMPVLAQQKAAIKAQLTQVIADTELADAVYLAQLDAVITKTQTRLDTGAAELAEGKAELDAASDQIDAGNSKAYYGELDLKEAEEELADGEQKLADAKKELKDGKRELQDAEQKFSDAEKELTDGEQEYEEARLENEGKIADAKVKIADARQELADLEEPEWYVLDRQYIQTYVEYGSNADRIGAIGELFPLIFFLVAALVSLTTMTRMVEEQRTQIGTLKALGYGKWAIASKYMLYALFSSLLGSLVGLTAGQKILPTVIISAYKIMYNNLPDILVPLNLEYSVTATAAAVLCTTLAAWAACYKELNAVPAKLMRPEAPKAGKRVFLEHLPFIWKHLNFSQKAAVRNLIRYKKRFFMTVFGIGGCMALLLVGFGLKDSILYIGKGQYGEVFVYDGTIGYEKDAKEVEREELFDRVRGDERITHFMQGRETALDVEAGGAVKSAYLIVPEEKEELSDYIHLQDRITKEAYTLDSDGVIINEKLAKLLNVSEGDTILLKEDDTKQVQASVSHIAENYFMNYVYMDGELYEKLYGETPEWNQLFFTDTIEKEEERAMQEEYMTLDAVSDVTFISGTAERIADMLRSMDLIIYVLVIAAGLLAFIVLYNLNNININERKRELATLKVLGFFDQEVLDYVNRENVMLTLFGTFAGIGLGILLHRFVIVTAEIDMLMFGRIITVKSYIYSILLTFVFSAVVNGVMFFRLRAIDMVESLKSVE